MLYSYVGGIKQTMSSAVVIVLRLGTCKYGAGRGWLCWVCWVCWVCRMGGVSLARFQAEELRFPRQNGVL